MMNSSMKVNLKKAVIHFCVTAFWLLIWDIAAYIFKYDFILPNVKSTLFAICELFSPALLPSTLGSIFSSLKTIFSGFFIGTFMGIVLATISILIPAFKIFISPIMSIAKSIPVTAIILMLWLIIGGSNVPMAIALIMVMPIIWQSVISGNESIDKNLNEVCYMYEFNPVKRIRLLVIPVISKFILSALLTASGLAWKAGIAAEIICITKSSIGKEIYIYKSLYEGDKMFAWIVIILLISIIIEKLIGFGIRGIIKKWHL